MNAREIGRVLGNSAPWRSIGRFISGWVGGAFFGVGAVAIFAEAVTKWMPFESVPKLLLAILSLWLALVGFSIGVMAYHEIRAGLTWVDRGAAHVKSIFRNARDVFHYILPAMPQEEPLSLLTAIILGCLILGGIWLFVEYQKHTRNDQTIVLLLLADVLAFFILALKEVGRSIGGGVRLGFRLVIWWLLMWIGFFGLIFWSVALFHDLWFGALVPPILLLPEIVLVGAWWFGRRRLLYLLGGY